MIEPIEQGPFSMRIDREVLYLSGDFRSGVFFGKAKDELYRVLMQNAPMGTLDLSEVTFMDSDTMAFVLSVEGACTIVWSDGSWVNKRYVDYVESKTITVEPVEHVRHAMETFNEVLQKTIIDFYTAIEHGDENHKAWLKAKFKEYWGVDV